jgi:rhomboid family GlyGly-CTERM serine protease
MHLLLNLAGLSFIFVLFNDVWSYLRLTLTSFVSAITIIGGLWIFSPQIDWYVGLSGVLHGLLVAGAVLGFKRNPGISTLILAGVLFKTGYEQFTEHSDSYLVQVIEGKVVTDAHLFGIIGGVLAVVILALKEKIRKDK